jgi:glycosyltransferase involved in cell wall biosynthesis
VRGVKVLHVYSGNLYGGVERFLITLARERALAPEMDPAFALCFEGALARELRQTGAPVEILGAARASRPWTVFAASAALRRLLDRDRPDVTLFHSVWSLALLGGAARGPAALFLHDAVSPHWTTALARRRHPALVLCNSAYVASTARTPFASASVVTSPLAVTPSALPPGFDRSALRSALGVQDLAEVVILLAARLERWKGHRLLLAALARLGAGTRWRCWIAGGAQRPSDHTYLHELQVLAAAPALSGRVHFLGQRTDVPQLMAAADVHCQPNEAPEPFGIAFVEAMSAGLPVVTTALGGALEVVPPSAGLLVPPDATALADALASLIASPERRAELGAAGARHAGSAFAPARRLPDLAAHLATLSVLPRNAGAGYPPR